eukprot:234452-Prorocentrum_minimum.AAC.6
MREEYVFSPGYCATLYGPARGPRPYATWCRSEGLSWCHCFVTAIDSCWMATLPTRRAPPHRKYRSQGYRRYSPTASAGASWVCYAPGVTRAKPSDRPRRPFSRSFTGPVCLRNTSTNEFPYHAYARMA